MAVNVTVKSESMVNNHPEILRTANAILAVQLSPPADDCQVFDGMTCMSAKPGSKIRHGQTSNK